MTTKSMTKALERATSGLVLTLKNGTTIHKDGDLFVVRNRAGETEYEVPLYGTALMVAETLDRDEKEAHK
jgi:hypothetical protein